MNVRMIMMPATEIRRTAMSRRCRCVVDPFIVDAFVLVLVLCARDAMNELKDANFNCKMKDAVYSHCDASWFPVINHSNSVLYDLTMTSLERRQ